jgi:hypothetical protein
MLQWPVAGAARHSIVLQKCYSSFKSVELRVNLPLTTEGTELRVEATKVDNHKYRVERKMQRAESIHKRQSRRHVARRAGSRENEKGESTE